MCGSERSRSGSGPVQQRHTFGSMLSTLFSVSSGADPFACVLDVVTVVHIVYKTSKHRMKNRFKKLIFIASQTHLQQTGFFAFAPFLPLPPLSLPPLSFFFFGFLDLSFTNTSATVRQTTCAAQWHHFTPMWTRTDCITRDLNGLFLLGLLDLSAWHFELTCLQAVVPAGVEVVSQQLPRGCMNSKNSFPKRIINMKIIVHARMCVRVVTGRDERQ